MRVLREGVLAGASQAPLAQHVELDPETLADRLLDPTRAQEEHVALARLEGVEIAVSPELAIVHVTTPKNMLKEAADAEEGDSES